ncbi:hypothetical protein ABES58_07300 [Paenibacillus lautus]|uniref:hypothetical protein n=1 Tax=Paenibacillus lautus TaxID=1401 RepID=UPI003D2A6ACD
MKSLVVSDRAIYSFKHDWGLEEGQHVRIYAKYAGGGSDAFTVGLNANATPIDPVWVQSIEGIHFFIEHTDAWILEKQLLQIGCDEEGITLDKIAY